MQFTDPMGKFIAPMTTGDLIGAGIGALCYSATTLLTNSTFTGKSVDQPWWGWAKVYPL